jgi:two-component system response regulator AtoC
VTGQIAQAGATTDWRDGEPKPEAETQDAQELSLDTAVERLERRLIVSALKHCAGSKAKAARLLKISERTLWYKLKKYDMN